MPGPWEKYQKRAPIPTPAAPTAPVDPRPVGYQTAETLHTDESGKTLSFPHMAAPADPEAQRNSAIAISLAGLSGGVLPFLKGVGMSAVGGAGGSMVGEAAERYGAPQGTSSVLGGVGAVAAPFVGLRGIANLARSASNPRGTILKIADKLDPKPRVPVKPPVSTPAPGPTSVSADPVITGRTGSATQGQIWDQVKRWKTESKFSDAQVVSSLEDIYHIERATAKELVSLFHKLAS